MQTESVACGFEAECATRSVQNVAALPAQTLTIIDESLDAEDDFRGSHKEVVRSCSERSWVVSELVIVYIELNLKLIEVEILKFIRKAEHIGCTEVPKCSHN